MKHVSDIAEKYLIAGETQDTALMFVPSESVYAEIHDGFDDVIQKAYRARVVLVSPSLLMLAIQVMQQILKDARMRDAADQIRTEVLNLGDDLTRLRDRVLKLQKHFSDANEDVRQILISADKIEKRAGRIEELDFSKDRDPRGNAAPRQAGHVRAIPAAAQAAGGGVGLAGVTWSPAAPFAPTPCAETNPAPRGENPPDSASDRLSCMIGIWFAIQASEILGCARRSSCKAARGDIVLSSHAGGRREHPMGADEVAALPDAFARQSNGLVVIAPDELRVGGDAAKNRRKWIARAQPQRAPRGNAAFFPPPDSRHNTRP